MTVPERSTALRICRFDSDRLGVVDGARIRDVTPAVERLPPCRWPSPPGDALIASLGALRPHIQQLLPGAPTVALDRARLQSPVANPGKVIAVRSNYPGASSSADDGPTLFLKASSSVAGPSASIELRLPGRRVDHEVELVAVLGLRKSLDGFTVLGPWLTTADEAAGVADAAIELAVNGELRQSGRTSQMTLGVGAIIAEASRYFVLEPGDVVMTGTPPGVGPLAEGDEVYCAIEGLGTMRVTMR